MALDLEGLVDLFESVGVDPAGLRSEDDPFARGRVVLDWLLGLAATAPTIIAIDDVQWLDVVSARALRYALRRIEDEPVGVVSTLRSGLGGSDPLALSTGLPPDRYELIDLGPLGIEDLRRVLAGTVASITRPALRRIHEVSGGNPLYAIELARGLELDGEDELAPGVSLPGSLHAAIARRLERVPGELVPLLETASALGSTSVQELREALPDDDVDGLLVTAEHDGLVVVEDDLQVHLSHPLVGSAVYGRMSPLARRRLHARLADRATDADRRARHLALSTDEPDAEIAIVLEEAAERASRRGASDLAAEFAGHSVRLTPSEDADAGFRRAMARVTNLAAAGEVSRARAVSDELIERMPAGPARAEMLIQRFYVESEDLAAGDAVLSRALEDAGPDERLRGRVLDILGWLRGMYRGDLRAGSERAREALAIADRLEDPGLQMLAAGHLGHMEALAGRPRPDLMDRAVALAADVGRPPLGGGPRAWHAKQLLWAGELAAARAVIGAVLEDDVRTGHELERPYRLYDLALLQCATGELAEAEETTRRGIEAAVDAENADAEGWLFYPLASVLAWLGRPQESRVAAARLIQWESRRGGLPGIARARSVLGLLALSEGDAGTAVRELTDGATLLEAWGFAHPGAIPILPDAVEALSLGGDLPAAEALLRRLDAEVEALGSEWSRAALERSRGAWLVSSGDPVAATVRLEGAAAVFDRLGHRPDAARAELWRGRALLRAGRRTVAADVLADASARFASMGATLWRARAEDELERAAPGRSAGRLTESERRIASLVSRGLTNREIARELHLSVASVEAHLTRAYRKLEVRSRSELSGWMAEDARDARDRGERSAEAPPEG
jgi:DNA-binding CsgD family transcriptional regulator